MLTLNFIFFWHLLRKITSYFLNIFIISYYWQFQNSFIPIFVSTKKMQHSGFNAFLILRDTEVHLRFLQNLTLQENWPLFKVAIYKLIKINIPINFLVFIWYPKKAVFCGTTSWLIFSKNSLVIAGAFTKIWLQFFSRFDRFEWLLDSKLGATLVLVSFNMLT